MSNSGLIDTRFGRNKIYAGQVDVCEDNIKLHKNISIPSEIHIYSLGVEYMKQWFLKKFEDGYFKTIHINGKHVFDDARQFNKEKLLKIEKPAVAITPTVDYDYNRDTVDLKLGGRDIFIRRSQIFDDSIFKDYENNIFLGTMFKQVQMNFTFRIRVGSKAQQIDLYNFIKYAMRVGSTQSEYMSYDFHIPYDIMLNMAVHSGFKVMQIYEGNSIYNKRVVDNVGFLRYINAHSIYPFIYKLRTINGNPEYFIRVHNMYTHISNLDGLSLDDGEREGALDDNFHIEMNCILKIPCPQSYYYYSSDNLEKKFKLEKELAGMYSINSLTIPDLNEKGWEQYLCTEWVDDNKHLDTIEFKELFDNEELLAVIDRTKSTGISPSIFIDIQLYNNKEVLDRKIDWETFSIVINSDVKDPNTIIGIYVDLGYVNEQLIVIQDLYNSRMVN